MIPLNNKFLTARAFSAAVGERFRHSLPSRARRLKSGVPLQVARAVVQQFALSMLCLSVSACATQHYDARPISAERIATDLNSRSLFSLELKNFVRSHSPQGEQSWPPSNWDLGSLTLVAFFFNPDLEAARTKLAKTEAGQITAAQRPNPVLQVPFQRTVNPKQGESPWTLGFALDIPIITAGKSGYLISEAGHLAAASRLQLAETAWNVRSQLREQLLMQWAATGRVKLNQAQLELDQRLLLMLEKRLSQGYSSSWEVNQQRLSVILAQNELLATQREAATISVAIAKILGLRVGALAAAELDLTSFGQAVPDLPSEEIRNFALLNRADIRASLAQYEASQAALQLAVAKQYPDIHLGPGYTLDQGARKVGFDFTAMELPIFNRNEGPIAEARGRRREAEAQVTQLEARAFAETDSAVAAYRTTKSIVSQNHVQLAVQLRQLETSKRALELGEDDRMSLVLAQKAELVAELALLNAVTAMQQAVGKVEDSMQRPITTSILQHSSSGLTK